MTTEAANTDKIIKRIAVLTSGGDAPGMNAAVRSVVRTAITEGIEVFGVDRGYKGLINKDFHKMTMNSVSDIINSGGTVLFTARSKEFETEEGMQKAIENMRELGIEALVVIGGDGSYRGANDLVKRGFPCVCLPGTIDNDISSTDYTIGFDTALNTAIDMIDRIRDSAQSHDRCFVVEVMGRRAGYLALRTAIGAGATDVLVPERIENIEASIESVCEKIRDGVAIGKNHFIIIVAEGVSKMYEGGADRIAKVIESKTGVETRADILGYSQRGGRPTGQDRVNATRMGYYAAKLLSNGVVNRVVSMDNDVVIDIDIEKAIQAKSHSRPIFSIW